MDQERAALEQEASVAFRVQLEENRRSWQRDFNWRFKAQVPIQSVMPGGVRPGAKVYLDECEFEPSIYSNSIGWTCWYMRWRCPLCGWVSDEFYVNDLETVGRVITEMKERHTCAVG